jgi:aryl-alcohol dehydrogenase-like predicted oxidoreductase
MRRFMEKPVSLPPDARRDLPGVGSVARVVLGAMTFERLAPGGVRARADYDAVFAAAAARGIEAIDTAPLYGFGDSERIVGDWLRRSGARMRVLTKVGLVWDAPDAHGDVLFQTQGADGRPLVVRRDSRPRSVLAEIDRSRERLGVSRLDLVQVHHRDREVPIDETMGALCDAWRDGKVAAVGVSNHDAADLEQASRAIERLSGGALRLSCTQGLYNLLSREAERDVFKVVRARGLGFLAFSPLAQGLLTGAMGPERAVSDWRAQTPLFSVANRRVIAAAIDRELAPLARRHGVSVSALALAWAISREEITSAIVGARDAKQLTASLDALSLVADRAIDPRVLDRVGDAFSQLDLSLAPSPLEAVRARLRRLFH